MAADEALLVKVETDKPYRDLKEEIVNQLEKAYFASLLKTCGGNVSEVARRSGINRRHIHDLMNKHGLGNRGSE